MNWQGYAAAAGGVVSLIAWELMEANDVLAWLGALLSIGFGIWAARQ